MLENKIIQNQLIEVAQKHPELAVLPEQGIIHLKNQDKEIIPLLAGGGSGHEPAHFGYVGKGMLTGSISGEIFIPPKAEDILQAIHLLNQGKGVFVIVKNFEADLKSFGAAIRQARNEGIDVRYVVSHDDISVDVANHYQVRHRGVAGTVLLHKILGEAALKGATLDELEALSYALSVSIYTIGATKSAVYLPGEKEPLFHLPKGQLSLGIGIHGESGYRQEPFVSLEYLANELLNKLKIRCRFQEGQSYLLLINNLGGFKQEDQEIFTKAVLTLLEIEGVDVAFVKGGKFVTSLNMEGISITLCPLKNPLWLTYLNAPTQAFAWQ